MDENSNKSINLKKEIYEWAETFCTALIAVVVVFTFVFRFVTVDGHSMDHTLNHSDRLIISDLFYTPKTGDIVVIHDSTDILLQEGPIIKRVIATEGETVDIDFETWTVTVTDKEGNTRELYEPYVNRVDEPMTSVSASAYFPHAPEYPHTVADGCVYVLGDNRNESLDSRYLGDIDERMVLGKAYLRLLPFSKIKFFG